MTPEAQGERDRHLGSKGDLKTAGREAESEAESGRRKTQGKREARGETRQLFGKGHHEGVHRDAQGLPPAKTPQRGAGTAVPWTRSWETRPPIMTLSSPALRVTCLDQGPQFSHLPNGIHLRNTANRAARLSK